MNNEFKIGQRVEFDVEGSEQKPFGYGQITYVDPITGKWAMTPNHKFNGNIIPINVRPMKNPGKV